MGSTADRTIDKLIIYPCSHEQTKGFFLILFSTPLLVWGLYTVIIETSNLFALIAWITFSVLIGFGLIMFIINTYLNLPQLELNTKGIRFKHSILKTQFHRWVDVGTFSIDYHVVKHKYSSTTYIYACAYNDINHDALFFNGRTAEANMHDANILIPINELDGGTCLNKAVSITKILNEWREKHGAPENNAQHLSKEEIDSLEAKHIKKRQLGTFWIIAASVLVVIIRIFTDNN